jgi:hypothetical protein
LPRRLKVVDARVKPGHDGRKKRGPASTRGKSKPTTDQPPAIVFHDLVQAIATLSAAAASGRPVALWSAPGAALYLGCGWFAAVERRARAAVPGAAARFVIDCADRADLVQEAFAEGITDACFAGSPALAGRLTDIAHKSRARLHRRRPRALDLAGLGEPEATLRDFLGGN